MPAIQQGRTLPRSLHSVTGHREQPHPARLGYWRLPSDSGPPPTVSRLYFRDQCGLVVDRSDPAALAAALSALSDPPEIAVRARLGERQPTSISSMRNGCSRKRSAAFLVTRSLIRLRGVAVRDSAGWRFPNDQG
jgi:hypothetical protein